MSKMEEFEIVWQKLKTQIRYDEPSLPRVPVDWPWEKRCAYWLWLAQNKGE